MYMFTFTGKAMHPKCKIEWDLHISCRVSVLQQLFSKGYQDGSLFLLSFKLTEEWVQRNCVLASYV